MSPMLSGAALFLAGFGAPLIPAAIAQPAPFAEDEFTKTGHKPVDGARLHEMFLGNTAYTLLLRANEGRAAGYTRITYFKSESEWLSANSDLQNGSSLVVRGKWWIAEDTWCLTYPHSGDTGREATKLVTQCYNLYDLGGVMYVCFGGKRCNAVIRIVPGNPENL